MRKGWLSSVATALVGAGSALAQGPSYLPGEAAMPVGPAAGMPALLSAEPAPPPPAPPAPPAMTGGSTGLVPGVDCLPESVPHHDRFFGDVAYMLTWIKNGPNPGPLAVAAPAGAPLFGPGTTALIGGRDIEYDAFSGVRATAGMWFGCDAAVGVEAAGFLLERQALRDRFVNDGTATNPVVLARPFVDVGGAGLTGFPVGGPGFPGDVAFKTTSRLWGSEANALLNWRDDGRRRTDLLTGFTYYNLRERLGVSSSTTIAGTGASVAFDDEIDTRNQYYGWQVGTRTAWSLGRLSLTMTSKLALGLTHEAVDRFGNSTLVVPGVGPVASPTGFLVQPSNAGRVTTDRFAVALPSQLLVGYQVTNHVTAFVGYDFMYISSVARPGDQVDLAFQTSPATGAAVRPAGGMRVDDFWANSALFGLAVKF